MFNGERLKQARMNKGYTQAELANVTGVKQQMISKLETGKSAGTADIVKLAYALDVEPAWLEGLAEESAPYTRHIISGNKLNEIAIEMVFEFIKLHYRNEFINALPAIQTQIFLICYETCCSSDASSNTPDKEKLFSAISKSLKHKLL